ncbi:hypothetical protein LCGC14_0729930 [marine sediment metagenome]|uniref:Uncharacterized protein n=1 Tax=marine sediment metagenome TaxID=412755 RepID=A0A0F9QUZ6_9ZZZZ
MTELVLNKFYEIEGQQALYIARIPNLQDQYATRALFLSVTEGSEEESRMAMTRSVEFRNFDLEGNEIKVKRMVGIGRECYREGSCDPQTIHTFTRLQKQFCLALDEKVRSGE